MFYPGAQAIHDRGQNHCPFPAHFAVAQQRSVLHYWTKHHTFFGVLGIRCIMLFHHSMRYMIAFLSDLAGSHKGSQNEVSKQLSGACQRQLLYGSVPAKPEEQIAT